MKVADFFVQQATKSGADLTTDANKAAIAALEGLTAEIPDELAKHIDSKFITLEAAKNNHPDIKLHYSKPVFDTIDKINIEALKELGVPQEEIDQMLTAEQSSFKRGPVFMKKLKELEAKKANANKPDQQAIQKQIDDLHATIRAKDELVTRTLADKAQFEKDMKLNYRQDALFAKAKTKYDDLDLDLKNTTLRTILNKSLQDNNAMFDLDDNSNLILLKKDKTNFFNESNQPVNAQQYIDTVLARNKLLVTNATPPPGGSGTPPPNGGTPPAGNSGKGAAQTSTLFRETREQGTKDYAAGSMR